MKKNKTGLMSEEEDFNKSVKTYRKKLVHGEWKKPLAKCSKDEKVNESSSCQVGVDLYLIEHDMAHEKGPVLEEEGWVLKVVKDGVSIRREVRVRQGQAEIAVKEWFIKVLVYIKSIL